MQLRELFPKMCALLDPLVGTQSLIQTVLAVECDLAPPKAVYRLCNIMAFLFNFTQQQGDLPEKWAQAVYADLLSAKARLSQSQSGLDLVQFDVFVSMAKLYSGRKQMSALRRALIYALSDDAVEEGEIEFHFSRFTVFANMGSDPLVCDSLLYYIECLYYYSRITGDLRELATALLSASVVVSLSLLPRDEAVQSCLMLAEWDVVSGGRGTSAVISTLRRLDNSEGCSRSSLKQIRISLANRLGASLGLNCEKYARLLLSEHETELEPHERLHAVASLFVGDPARPHTDRQMLFGAIEGYDRFVKDVAPNPALHGYEKARSFSIVRGAVLRAIEYGLTDFATEILHCWRGINTKVKRDTLLIAPCGAQGMTFAHNGEVLIAGAHDRRNSLNSLVLGFNQFHGVNLLINDEPDFRPVAHARPGIPDVTKTGGDAYSANIVNHFGIKEESIINFLKAMPNDTSMMLTPWISVPLQSVMMLQVGRTFPFSVTLAEPLPDRPIKKALIWPADTYIASRSAGWLRDAFQSCGIEVVVPEPSLATFQSMYSDPSLDVLWIIGHGTWNHFDYHLSHFSVTHQESPTLEWWATLPVPQGDRRLLVLDLCDSGSIAVSGGMPELGLPPLLATPTQAVIGNLWPVNQIASAVQGALLALRLGEQNGFFAGYSNTMMNSSKGIIECRKYIAERLSDQHDIINAVDNNISLDFEALAHWGSLVFWE